MPEPGERRRVRRWPLLWVLLLTILVGSVVLTGSYWWLIPVAVQSGPPARGLTSAQRFTAAFAIATALGAIVALVVNTRRQDLAEREAAASERRDARDQERSRASQFTERFAAAATLLGRPTAAERISGVYAMAALADDYKERRQQCVDVLCGYLRLPWSPVLDQTQSVSTEENWTVVDGRNILRRSTAAHTPHDRIVRTTISAVIRAHLIEPESPVSWSPLNFDFRGALLENADFARATFGGASTSFADVVFAGKDTAFLRACFPQGVSFLGATFSAETTSFDWAVFEGGVTSFVDVKSSGNTIQFLDTAFDSQNTRFDGASFSGSETCFDGAMFTGESTTFNDATFCGEKVTFNRTSFSSKFATFLRAEFKSLTTSFARANFTGGIVVVDASGFREQSPRFDGATFSGVTSFDGAMIDGSPFDPSLPSGAN